MTSTPRTSAHLVALAASLVGCAGASSPAPRSSTDGAGVIAADRAFDAESGARGVAAAFHDFTSDDGWILAGGEPAVHGRAGIDAAYAKFPPGASLRWAPTHGEESADGTLGWTWGTYTYRPATGATSGGKYVTVWRREHGTWRVISDVGVEDPAPPVK